MGLAPAARAHPLETALAVQAHRQDVVGADKDFDLADLEIVALKFDRLQNREQRVAILFKLWPLMPVARVLNRQLVQPKLLAHLLELCGLWILQRNPDETIRSL